VVVFNVSREAAKITGEMYNQRKYVMPDFDDTNSTTQHHHANREALLVEYKKKKHDPQI